MLLPRYDVIHPQRDVIVAIDGRNRIDPSEEMQYMVRAQPDPLTRKIERRVQQQPSRRTSR